MVLRMIHRHHLATVAHHPTGGDDEAILQIEGKGVKWLLFAYGLHHSFSDNIDKFPKCLWWSSFVANKLRLATWRKIDFSLNFMKIENFINSYLNILSWKFSKIRRAMFSGITLESGCLFKGCYFCVNSCFASIFGAFQNWILFRNHIYGHVESCKCYYQLWHLDIKLLLPLVPCFSYRFVYLLQLQIIC